MPAGWHISSVIPLGGLPELGGARGFQEQVNGYLPHRWPAVDRLRARSVEPRPFGPFPVDALTAGDVFVADTGHGVTRVVVEDRVWSIASDELHRICCGPARGLTAQLNESAARKTMAASGGWNGRRCVPSHVRLREQVALADAGAVGLELRVDGLAHHWSECILRRAYGTNQNVCACARSQAFGSAGARPFLWSVAGCTEQHGRERHRRTIQSVAARTDP